MTVITMSRTEIGFRLFPRFSKLELLEAPFFREVQP
jgi:hypothetical protein